MLLRNGRWLAIGLMSLAAGAPAARGASPTSGPTSQDSGEIAALIQQLCDDRWQTRNRAVDRLVEFGDEAVCQLQSVCRATTNVDLRARVELTLKRIEEARRSGASLITIHLKSVAPRLALDELARQAHLRFEAGANDPGATPVSLDADHKPLWLVLRNLCAQTSLGVTSVDASGTITLQHGDQDWAARPASITGPYMLVARRMDLNRSLDFARPKDLADSYTLSLLAYAEPKLHPVYWAVRGIDRCATETGKALELSPRDGAETGDLNCDNEVHFSFTAPPEAGTRLAKLRLAARFVLSDQTQKLEIQHVLDARNDTRVLGTWRVTIKAVTRTDDQHYSASVSVFRDNHAVEEWAERTGVLERALPRLLDASGKALDSGSTSLNAGPDEWNWTDEFTCGNGQGKPATLQWDFPIVTRHADVTFEFKDLPLP